MKAIQSLTWALLINSRKMGFPLCSRVSRIRVNGLALSRRFSSFWSNSSACERACDCVVDGGIA